MWDGLFWGRKQFGSLTPIWTRLGIHAMHAGDQRGPQIVRAFLPRDAAGYRVEENWDTLGKSALGIDLGEQPRWG